VLAAPASAAPKREFRVCWSIYAGWIPWEYGAASGIVDKWAKKYGIGIDVVQINDYAESLELYAAGEFDGCTMTNMDALTVPAAAGVDSTALIIGDFSNGNDGIVLKGAGKTLADIKGRTVHLVEMSVSHYLLGRGLQRYGISDRDIRFQNISDAEIVAAFANPDIEAVVTWNPQLAEVAAMPGVSKVFDSRQIPGEIIDLMVVNTDTLKRNPALGKALTGAWYEIMDIMSADTDAGSAARAHMARVAGTDLAGYEAQLATTRMFYSAAKAVEFATSPRLPVAMSKVASFSFEQGMLGQNIPNADAIGMSFHNDLVGDKANIKLRFDPTYMQMAANGALSAAAPAPSR
jgi:NitT/TauT family transport system substrate-binding protein